MKRLLSFLVFSLFSFLIFSAQASWYWPFGHDEDSTNAPPRLHRLLEKANDYIELAEDEALNGNADKAIENYKLALGELDRVEAENPDRAEKPEFAPLRNRRAVCTAAIDAIRFAQVNENERPVAVSDTTELQKKWNQKHGIKDPADEQAHPKEEKPAEAAKKEEVKSETVVENKEPQADEAPKSAEKEAPVKAKAPVEEKKEEVDEPIPTDWDGRVRYAMKLIRARDYVAADVLLESLLKERPTDLNAQLLRAAAQTGVGSNYAARRTLEKAMRTNPRSYLPYYNLAQLTLVLGEGAEVARQYYEMGRTVGGPVNLELEKKIKVAK